MMVEASERRGFLARPSGKILVILAALVLVLALVRGCASDAANFGVLRADIRRLSDAVETLALEVEALARNPRAGVGAQPDAPSAPAVRTAAVESPDTLAAIARLEQLVRDLAQRPAHTSGTRPTSVPGRQSIRDIRGSFDLVRAGEYVKLDDTLTSEHLLWPVEDVLARYGLPLRIETTLSSPSLVYELDDDGSAFEPPWVKFVTTAGRVTRVEVMPGR